MCVCIVCVCIVCVCYVCTRVCISAYAVCVVYGASISVGTMSLSMCRLFVVCFVWCVYLHVQYLCMCV